MRLAVPPGRYLLRKRVGASTGLLELELPYGSERQVREEALTWRRYTEVALLGLVRLESAAVLGYRHSWGPWWALGTLSFSQASYPGMEV